MFRALAMAGVALAAGSAPMALHSRDFSDGGRLPRAAMSPDCGGKDRSPELHWSEVPHGVKSFALVLHDPDAPIAGGFDHWVVYNLAPATHRLAAGVNLPPGELGQTTPGRRAYVGPCPPAGPAHHYVFTLYALDVAHLGAVPPTTASQLAREIAGHVLAQAVLRGTASRP